MKRILAAWLLCIASNGLAHDLWLEPSSFHPPLDSTLQVRLQIGVHLVGDPLPRYSQLFQRFTLVGPDSSEVPMLGLDGSEPAGLVRIQAAGLGTIVYESTGNSVNLEPAKFHSYLHEEGLEKIFSARQAKGELEKPVREIFYRSAKSMIQAGGSSQGSFAQVLGLPLEIIPEVNPTTLSVGDTLPVRLLYEGKPLPGALLMALNPADPNHPIKQRSDAEGRTTFTLPHPGFWLIKAVEMIPARPGKDADWESFWASLTFQLGNASVALQPASNPSTSSPLIPVSSNARPDQAPDAPPRSNRLPFAGGILVALILAARRLRVRRS